MQRRIPAVTNISRLGQISPDSRMLTSNYTPTIRDACLNVHETMRSDVFYMILRDLFTPATDLEELSHQHANIFHTCDPCDQTYSIKFAVDPWFSNQGT
jgi:hypothetical protein